MLSLRRIGLSFALVIVTLSMTVAFAAEPAGYGMGERPPTAEELAKIAPYRVDLTVITPTETALQRVNAERAKIGMPPLTLDQLTALWAQPVSEPASSQNGEFIESVPVPSLPTAVDNSATTAFPPIRSQGGIGSCGSWAAGYYQFTYTVAREYGWDASSGDNQYIFSPKFIYNMINGGSDSGSSYGGNYGLLLKHGCARWLNWPYDSNYRAWDLNADDWKDAMHFRMDAYGSISNLNSPEGIRMAKQLIASGHVLRYSTYISSWHFTTVQDDPGTTDDDAFVGQALCDYQNGYTGAHAMTIVGYNDSIWRDLNGNSTVDPGEKGAFKIANSWGSSWRNSGFAWVLYDAMYATSQVTGGPNPSTRRSIFWGNRAQWIRIKKNYTPKIIAEFTLNHPERNDLILSLGISDTTETTPTTYWYPDAIRWDGGAYAFDGTTTACNGSFAFDFTDIVENDGLNKRYYLNVQVNAGYDCAVSDFQLTDTVNTVTIPCADVPTTAPNGDTTNLYIDYTFGSTNTPPTISSISDTLIPVDEYTGDIAFTVGDAESAVSTLSVWGTSSNATLVPDPGITFGGADANRTVAVTPLAGQTGSAIITVYVSDGEDITSTKFCLHVTATGNTPPAISAVPDQSTTAGVILAIPFTITDAETPVSDLDVNVTFTNELTFILHKEVTGTGTNRVLYVTPRSDAEGDTDATISVGDGELTQQQWFTLTVTPLTGNTTPTISSIPDVSADQGTVIKGIPFTVGDAETDAGSLTINYSLALWLFVDNVVFEGTGADRTLTIIPRSGHFGTDTMTVTVSDGQYESSTSFQITYNPTGNTPPSLSPIPDIAIGKNETSLPIPVTVMDSEMDADYLQVQFDTSDNWSLIDWSAVKITGEGAQRFVTVTPKTDQTGVALVTIRADDHDWTSSTKTSFTVTVYDNSTPTISDIANQTIPANTSVGPISFSITDVETIADSLTLSASSDDLTLVPLSNIVFGGSGENRTVTVTPATDQAGDALITVFVSDGELSASDTFVLTVTSADTPPTISNILNQLIDEDTSLAALSFTVGDLETPVGSLIVTAESSDQDVVKNTNIVIGGSGANRTIAITPEPDASGIITISIGVYDGHQTTTGTFLLTVREINDLPTANTIDDQTIYHDTSCGPLTITLDDPDTDINSYWAVADSDNHDLVDVPDIMISGSRGSWDVTVTPKPEKTGTARITITITSWIANETVDVSFLLTVLPNAAPAFDASGFSSVIGGPAEFNAAFQEGDTVSAGALGIGATDSDGDGVTITITKNAGASTYTGTVEPAFTSPVWGLSPTAVSMTVVGVFDGTGLLVYDLELSDSHIPAPITGTLRLAINPSSNNAPEYVTFGHASVTGGPLEFSAVFSEGDTISLGQLGISATDVDSGDSLTLTIAKNDSLSTYDGAVEPTFSSPASGNSPLSIDMSTTGPLDGGGTLVYDLTLTDGVIVYARYGQLTVTVQDIPQFDGSAFSRVSGGATDFTATVYEGEPISADMLGITGLDADSGDTLTLTATLTGSGTYDGTVLPTFTSPVTEQSPAILSMATPGLDGTGTLIYDLTLTDGTTPVSGTLTITVEPNTAPAFDTSSFPQVTGGPTDFTIRVNMGDWPFFGIAATDPNIDAALSLSASRSSLSTYNGAYEPDFTSPVSGIPPVAIQFMMMLHPLDGFGDIVYDLTASDGITNTVGTLTLHVNHPPAYDTAGFNAVSGGPTTFNAAFHEGDTITAGQLGIRGVDTNPGDPLTLTVTKNDADSSYTGTVEPTFTTPAEGQSAISIELTTAAALDGYGTLAYDLTLSDTSDGTFTTGKLMVTVYSSAIPSYDAAAYSRVTGVGSRFRAVYAQGDTVSAGELGISGVDSNAANTLVLDITKNPASTYAGSVEPTFTSPATGNSSVGIGMTAAGAFDNVGVLEYDLSLNNGVSGSINGRLIVYVNDPPLIDDIPDQSMNADETLGPIAFAVSDGVLPNGDLTVTATSSDTILIPESNITITRSGFNCNLSLTPAAGQSGTATITVTVDDGFLTAADTFTVSVNAYPTISAISDQTIDEDTDTGAIAFTVGDIETAAASLIVTGSSSNSALVTTGDIVFGGSGANRTVTVTPLPDMSGTATISVTVDDGSVATAETFLLTVNPVNDIPTISAISDQTIDEDTGTGAIAFTVGDIETAAGSLTLAGSSSNGALVTTGNIVFGGSGANRTVTVTPLPNMSGTATITVTVNDGTDTANVTFLLTVNPVNDAPSISAISDQTIDEDTDTGAIAFTIGDVETAAGSLTLAGSSSNSALVTSGNITFGGSGANRTVTVTPLPDMSGTTTITVTVNDGTDTANATFLLTVNPVNDAPAIDSGISAFPDPVINQDYANLLVVTHDIDGPSASTFTWEKVSGPGTVSFSPNGGTGSDSTTVSFDMSGSYLLRVTVSDGVDSTTDSILLDVTLPPPAITLLSPNGGETYFGGQIVHITWGSISYIGDVSVAWYDGSAWSTIVLSTTDDGAYSWPVPNADHSGCRIRLSSTGTGALSDESDATFVILSITDVDGDGMDDTWETNHFGDLSTTGGADGDSDGLTNLDEFHNGTDPAATDSDGDGLNDGDEVDVYGTNPMNPDCDGDGLNDGDEIAAGTDPFDTDSDDDAMDDNWEVLNGLNPTVNDASLNADGDPASNLDEYLAHTDPQNPASYPGAKSHSNSGSCAVTPAGAAPSGGEWLILLSALGMVVILKTSTKRTRRG